VQYPRDPAATKFAQRQRLGAVGDDQQNQEQQEILEAAKQAFRVAWDRRPKASQSG